MGTISSRPSKLLLIMAAALFAAFAGLTVAVSINPVNGIDLAVSRYLQSARWASFFKYADLFFNEITLRVFCLILIVYALMRKRYAAAGLFAMSAVIEIISMIVKPVVHRPRPSAELVLWPGESGGFSYISSHTFEYAFFFWITAFLIFYSRLDKRYQRTGSFAIAILGILPLVVGADRIYTGNHWFTDVLGSYLFAGGIVLITVLLMPKTFSRAGERRSS